MQVGGFDKPQCPRGLSDRAKDFWRSIADNYILRPDEYEILRAACQELMLIDRMQTKTAESGFKFIVKGSMGQDVANPILTEIRQHRMTLASLLKQMKLPDAATANLIQSDEATAASREAASVARFTSR